MTSRAVDTPTPPDTLTPDEYREDGQGHRTGPPSRRCAGLMPTDARCDCPVGQDAFALADDPVWGPLYREVIRDRYAQMHAVIARHVPRITAALATPDPSIPERPEPPETVSHEPDARTAALIRALVAERDNLRLWLAPGDGDAPDAHVIAPRLLAALASIPERPEHPFGIDHRDRSELDDYQRGYVDGFDAPVNVEARAALGSIPERPAEPLLARFIDTNEGPVMVTDGHHVRPATELELAFRAALVSQSTPESRDE